MNKHSKFYIQDDAKWGSLHWYAKGISDALREASQALNIYAENSSSKHRRILLETAQKFCDEINDLPLSDTYHQTDEDENSLAQSGCWHTSVANMLTLFDVKLNKETSTPPVLLKALREHMLGTLTGYVETPFVDPLSIITGGDVQLSRYHDFGKDGADRNDPLLNDLLSSVNGVITCAIVNVCAHEIFGTGDSHYVLVKSAIDNDYEIQDPGWPETTRLFDDYSDTGFYQVSIYRKYYR
jgi:hypothetical protein